MAWFCNGKQGICDCQILCQDCQCFDDSGGKEVQTNADWIRAMPDKDLVQFIGHNSLCDRVQGEAGDWCNDHNCTDCLELWLKQPAKDEC